MDVKVQFPFILTVLSCLGIVVNSFSFVPISSSRIVGGSAASNVAIPYIVSLQNYGTHFCGGSIINERTVLTAAHCLVYKRPGLIRVHVGAKSRSILDGQIVSVRSIHYHENFSYETLDFDIGLVRLSRALRFGPTIQPIRLPAAGEPLADGTYGIISGWGFTSAENSTSTDMLRYAVVPIVSRAICYELLSGKITERMICAGYVEGGIDACQMDSGGPFVVAGRLFGLVSWGEGCAEPNKPGVYTSVSALMPWVENQLAVNYNERLQSGRRGFLNVLFQ